MINKSKEMLKDINITYKELSILLNITERQAMNILSKENKSLYNYLAIEFITQKKITELWQLEEKEKEILKKRLEFIKSNL
jgi:hypothetical protein